jgi:hypothetical protein
MGWWPSKLIVILNLIQMIGYCLINCVVCGQILSAVSPNESLSVAVGKNAGNFPSSAPATKPNNRYCDYCSHQLDNCYVRNKGLPLL